MSQTASSLEDRKELEELNKMKGFCSQSNQDQESHTSEEWIVCVVTFPYGTGKGLSGTSAH